MTSVWPIISQKTQRTGPVSDQCWDSVEDAVPALARRRDSASPLLDYSSTMACGVHVVGARNHVWVHAFISAVLSRLFLDGSQHGPVERNELYY